MVPVRRPDLVLAQSCLTARVDRGFVVRQAAMAQRDSKQGAQMPRDLMRPIETYFRQPLKCTGTFDAVG